MPLEHFRPLTDLHLQFAELRATLRDVVARSIESRARSEELRQEAREASARIAWLMDW
jgi:hypothetical protein